MAQLTLSLLLVSLFHAVRVLADAAFITDVNLYDSAYYGQWPDQIYYTLKIRTPRFFVHEFKPELASPETHFIISPHMDKQKKAPMIFDSRDLSLVYADKEWNGGNDAKIQYYNDKAYLTFFSGQDFITHASGGGIIVDQNYKAAFNITTVNLPTGADSHEFQLTDDGGAIVNNYHAVKGNATSVGGPEVAMIKTCAFQEIDIATGALRFTWQALDHFAVSETYGDKFYTADAGWDYFHMNAISKTWEGNYLISVRHLKMIAYINGKDGHVIWQLGGMNNQFKDLSGGRATNFAFQHNARFVDDTLQEITMFDNQVMHPGESKEEKTPGCTNRCSRGLRVRLNYTDMTAEVVSEFWHPQSVQAWAEGGYQLLPSGNVMMGWGVVPSITEYTASGELVMNLQTATWSTIPEGGSHIYRAVKANWTATPDWAPEIFVKDSLVYVSWNGATEVKQWALYAGWVRNDVTERVTIVPRSGFETAITRPGTAPFLRAEPLDKDGNVLSTTKVVEVASTRLRNVDPELQDYYEEDEEDFEEYELLSREF